MGLQEGTYSGVAVFPRFRFDRTVAIKILPEQLAASSDSRKRFESEARTVRTLAKAIGTQAGPGGYQMPPQHLSGMQPFNLPVPIE
jgi:hypothetical protein